MAIRLTLLALAIVIAVSLLGYTDAIPPWCNNYSGNCFYSSPSHRAISGIYSKRSWSFKDRRFSFTNDNVSPSYLTWFGQNGSIKYKIANCAVKNTNYNSHFAVDLPYNRVIVRVRSWFSDASKDRKFRFTYCRVVRQ